MVQIEYNNKYDKSLKKLKKYNYERDILTKIINLMKVSNSVNEFIDSPLAKLYKYEKLKYELDGYCSLNLSKNGGTIRLIFSTDCVEGKIFMEYISMEHYKDFKNKLKWKEGGIYENN